MLRQHHAPGDKLFVDYAGQTVPVIDRYTGQVREAQIFVAVFGCSNYAYAEATFSQALPDWLASSLRACASHRRRRNPPHHPRSASTRPARWND